MAVILFFGITRDITGVGEMHCNATDLENLLNNLRQQFPQLEKVRFRVAVNNALTSDNVKVGDNDTVALLPPFAGG